MNGNAEEEEDEEREAQNIIYALKEIGQTLDHWLFSFKIIFGSDACCCFSAYERQGSHEGLVSPRAKGSLSLHGVQMLSTMLRMSCKPVQQCKNYKNYKNDLYLVFFLSL